MHADGWNNVISQRMVTEQRAAAEARKLQGKRARKASNPGRARITLRETGEQIAALRDRLEAETPAAVAT